MLPKNERLKERYLFNLAFKKRFKINSNLATLYYLFKRKDINRFNDKKDHLPKIAFVVSTKIDKRATKRNLFKRRMKAAYKLVKQKLINTNKNKLNLFSALILVANPSIKDATFEKVNSSVEYLLNSVI